MRDPLNKIQIIINPAATGSEPILSYLNQLFTGTAIDWEVSVTRRAGEAYKAAREVVGKVDLVAIYGGDGSVMEVARALYKSSTPLAILPGGTANVMAKELQIPLELREAVQLLTSVKTELREVDMAEVNGCPFLIRVNLGILADMVTEASAELKEQWGQFAYGISAFQHLQHESQVFHLTIDGIDYRQEAVALTITNAGNIGQTGYSFLPGISISDGLLDIIALDKADFGSLLEVSSSVFFQTDSSVLKHWKAKEILIEMDHESAFLCDDSSQVASRLSIHISPKALYVLVPKTTEP